MTHCPINQEHFPSAKAVPRQNGPAKLLIKRPSTSVGRAMPKGLRLKRTPAEQAEHDLRKARKAAKKAASRPYLSRDSNFLDPGPSTSRHEPRAAPVADDSFHERLWDAFGDDDRLDSIEAQLNEYAYIPQRWRGASPHPSGPYSMDGGVENDNPALMNDDEYAEWVRVGMWRKRNEAAHREQQRQKAARAAVEAEAARIVKAKEDARRRARDERERRRRVEARKAYESRWNELVEFRSESADLGFGDIPWPVRGGAADISQLTVEAISGFLFEEQKEEEVEARIRKEELRGTMLRFHPDKFEGRIVRRVRDEDREAVRQGANAVTRAVAALMGSARNFQ